MKISVILLVPSRNVRNNWNSRQRNRILTLGAYMYHLLTAVSEWISQTKTLLPKSRETEQEGTAVWREPNTFSSIILSARKSLSCAIFARLHRIGNMELARCCSRIKGSWKLAFSLFVDTFFSSFPDDSECFPFEFGDMFWRSGGEVVIVGRLSSYLREGKLASPQFMPKFACSLRWYNGISSIRIMSKSFSCRRDRSKIPSWIVLISME